MPRSSLHVHVRLMLEDVGAMGPGKADLLEQIGAAGSISAAAKAMGMSYRRAWLLVDQMNACFASPLVEAAAGGAGGGGAQLTDFGREVLGLFRDMQAALDAQAASFHMALEQRLK
jgi:molybdate transport system regulatory protein